MSHYHLLSVTTSNGLFLYGSPLLLKLLDLGYHLLSVTTSYHLYGSPLLLKLLGLILNFRLADESLTIRYYQLPPLWLTTAPQASWSHLEFPSC